MDKSDNRTALAVKWFFICVLIVFLTMLASYLCQINTPRFFLFSVDYAGLPLVMPIGIFFACWAAKKTIAYTRKDRALILLFEKVLLFVLGFWGIVSLLKYVSSLLLILLS